MTKQMNGRSFPSVSFYLTMCDNVKKYFFLKFFGDVTIL